MCCHAAVAAGHPATVAAGIEILEEGGSAADAAVAASLASCVAETVMTGLLGGGHAIYWDGTRGLEPRLLRRRALGSGGAAGRAEGPVRRGARPLRGRAGDVRGPGLPRGLGALHARFGRLPWARLVEPALGLARAGVTMPPAHAACLAMLAPVFTMQPDGARIYAPAGRPLEAGEQLDQPGLVRALELLAAEGPDSPYVGSIAESLLVRRRGDRGVARPTWSATSTAGSARPRSTGPGHRFLTRGGLSGVPETLVAPAARSASSTPTARVHALLAALAGPGRRGPHDESRHRRLRGQRLRPDLEPRARHGRLPPRARPAAEQHARRGRPRPRAARAGRADAEHDGAEPRPRREGLVLAIGSAGGTRLRTALVGVAAGILDEGLDPIAAVGRPRFHRAGDVVNAEPGVDEQALARARGDGPARAALAGAAPLLRRRQPAGASRRRRRSAAKRSRRHAAVSEAEVGSQPT